MHIVFHFIFSYTTDQTDREYSNKTMCPDGGGRLVRRQRGHVDQLGQNNTGWRTLGLDIYKPIITKI